MMWRRAALITLWFTLAYVAACALAWFVAASITVNIFSPGGSVDHIPMVLVLPPLAGLALFQLVFGLVTGIGRGWRFWALGLPLVYAAVAVGLWLYFRQNQPWQTAGAAFITLSGGLGLYLALNTQRARA